MHFSAVVRSVLARARGRARRPRLHAPRAEAPVARLERRLVERRELRRRGPFVADGRRHVALPVELVGSNRAGHRSESAQAREHARAPLPGQGHASHARHRARTRGCAVRNCNLAGSEDSRPAPRATVVTAQRRQMSRFHVAVLLLLAPATFADDTAAADAACYGNANSVVQSTPGGAVSGDCCYVATMLFNMEDHAGSDTATNSAGPYFYVTTAMATVRGFLGTRPSKLHPNVAFRPGGAKHRAPAKTGRSSLVVDSRTEGGRHPTTPRTAASPERFAVSGAIAASSLG